MPVRDTMQKKPRASQRGGSAVEFALTLVFWAPLLMGVMSVSMNFMWHLTAQQIARDACAMYMKNADFTQPDQVNILLFLAHDMNLQTSGGAGEIIFSQVVAPSVDTCKSDPAYPSGNCPNVLKYVATQRVVVGNTALGNSNFGDVSGLTLSAKGNVALHDYLSRGALLIPSNSPMLAPNALVVPTGTSSDNFKAGSTIYVVEVYFVGYQFPGGFSNGKHYAYAIM